MCSEFNMVLIMSDLFVSRFGLREALLSIDLMVGLTINSSLDWL